MDNIYKKNIKLKNKKQLSKSATERERNILELLKRGRVEDKYSVLAQTVGTSRRSFCRTLKAFKEAGMVEVVKVDGWTGRAIIWKGGQNG